LLTFIAFIFDFFIFSILYFYQEGIVMKKFFTWITQKYKHKDSQTRHEVKSMVQLALGMFLVCAIMLFLLNNKTLVIILAVLMLFCILFLLLIRLGLNRLTAALMVITVNLIVGAPAFMEEFTGENAIYLLSFLQLFALVLTLVISTRKLYPVLSMIIGINASILFQFMKTLPGLKSMNLPISFTDMILSILLILFAGLIILTSNGRSIKLLKITRNQSEESKEKNASLVFLMEGMKQDFNTGDQLMQSAHNMGQNLEDLFQFMETIKKDTQSLHEGSERVEEASRSISNSSKTLSTESDSQSAHIEESSSAITEMGSSIENINRIALERQKAIEDLNEHAQVAGRAIEESESSMKKLLDWVSSLEEINNVINNIASQTSLLAMNAAIEAAHAGDSGKGFAVVADEVRKLSENSADNVRIIAETLSQITEAIHYSSEQNQAVIDVFNLIGTEIKNVSAGMKEIVQGIGELSVGTREINEGISVSVESTGKVREGVQNVNSQIHQISEQIENQNRTITEIVQAIQITIQQLESLREEGNQVKQVGDQNAQNLKNLEEKLKALS